jgi:hypothetical protein
MATLVQIKRSTSNTSPTTLLEGELAYSYVSNVIFIGDTVNGVMNVGGQYYTNLIDEGTAANSSATFVRRYANGSAQFSQLDILVTPTANSHVATKEYVDNAVQGDVTLASLNDVDIGVAFSDQNNKILIGNTAGYYVGTAVTGNVSISNTGIITIGSAQVTNSMLAGSISNDKLSNSTIEIIGGAGLSNGGNVALGSSLTIDVIAGDGISNANGDSVSVDTTVVRTDRNQTVNGFITFSNTVTITSDLDVTGNLYVSGNTSYINVATLRVDDPLIFLAANNTLTDIVDIGIFGTYNSGSGVEHSGFIRHAADKNWYLFDHQITDPDSNVVDIANSTYALLRANLEAQQLNVTTGFANVGTTLEVTGNTILYSNLTVSSNATFSQNANVTGTLNVGSLLSVTGNTELLANVSISQNANIAGTLNVGSSVWLSSLELGSPLPTGSGGTGLTSFVANGVWFANTTSTLSFATGTEGNVLQIKAGVPTFDMLDGGSF